MKKCLIFSLHYYPDFVGGAEVAVKEVTDRIPSEEIEFHMIALRTRKGESGPEKIGNITVHRIGFAVTDGALLSVNKHVYILLAPLVALYLHYKLRFDFAWSIIASYAGAAGFFFKLFHLDTPWLLTLQEGDPLEYILNLKRVKPFMGIFKAMFRRADLISVISVYLSEFAKNMGAKKDPVVVPNGVDVGKFEIRMSKSEREEMRKSLGFREGDTILVTASRLVIKNAVGDIIESLVHLPQNVKLLVLGKGELEENLKFKIENLKLNDRVVMKGFVSHYELPAYLNVSDIFIRPSLSEGFGNSFVEAMAARIPVIATRVGGIVDFLKDKETGLFCEVKNPEDIARKVQIYMHDKNLRDEIVENAFKMVEEKYDWNIVAQSMKERVFDILKS
jgi:glycosyltransferase involved in cell wall biosynthesis